MQAEQSSAVKAGIFVLVGGVVLIGAIMVLGQRAQLFTSHYALIARFKNAGGLIRGASVRVAGVHAGSVRSVEVEPDSRGDGIVVVTMEISESYRRLIRQGSKASIRTLGPLGDKYVEISPGPSVTPALGEGQEIPTEEAADFFDIAEEARKTFRQTNAIADEIRQTLEAVDKAAFVKNVDATAKSLAGVLDRVENGPSLIHTLIYEESMQKICEDLRVASQILRKAAEEIDAGEGALGVLLRNESAAKAVLDLSASAASARAILEEIEEGEGATNALVFDPEVRKGLSALADASRRLADILRKVQEGDGTLGLLVNDPEVWEGLKRLLASVEESRILRGIVERSAKKEEAASSGK
jgi:phospholipid/cholesterol/gamma-HCH transport system substrate-binding protein